MNVIEKIVIFAANLFTMRLFQLLVFVLIVFGISACKTDFDKLRLSNDKELKLSKAYEFYKNGDYLKAQYLFEDLIGAVRGTKDAESVYFHYALTHYRLKNYSFASYYFKQFTSTFPYGNFTEDAYYMSAHSFFKLSPDFKLTQEDTENAIVGLQSFINSYPESQRIDSCNIMIDLLRAKLEDKAIDNAYGYFHRKRYQASAHSFKNLLIDFPDSKQREYIRYMIAKSHFRFAQESVLSKQVERFEQTLLAVSTFETKHPESDYNKEIKNIKNIAINKIKKIRNEL